MNLYLSIACCFIPFILCFILFAIFVPGCKVRYCFLSSLIGLITLIPIVIIQFFVLNLPVFNGHNLVSLLVTAVIFNGLIEEALKMVCEFILPYKKLRLGAFLACGVLCGLVLGSFETVIYLIKGTVHFGVRLYTAVVIHSVCAGLSSLYVFSFKAKKAQLMPFIWAVLMHGFYNFFAAFSNGYRYLSFVVIAFALVELRQWYKSIKEQHLDFSAPTVDTLPQKS